MFERSWRIDLFDMGQIALVRLKNQWGHLLCGLACGYRLCCIVHFMRCIKMDNCRNCVPMTLNYGFHPCKYHQRRPKYRTYPAEVKSMKDRITKYNMLKRLT